MKTRPRWRVLAAVLPLTACSTDLAAATLNQTIQFSGVTPATLYGEFLSSSAHSAMTLDGQQRSTWIRAGVGPVVTGKVGDELYGFEFKTPDGKTDYRLRARLLEAIPGQVIVMSWKNLAWQAAVSSQEVTQLPSTVVLTFRKNSAGAEIQLVQINVPDYTIRLPDTGETGALSSIVNTHWNLIYWEPMKKYFAQIARGKATPHD